MCIKSMEQFIAYFVIKFFMFMFFGLYLVFLFQCISTLIALNKRWKYINLSCHQRSAVVFCDKYIPFNLFNYILWRFNLSEKEKSSFHSGKMLLLVFLAAQLLKQWNKDVWVDHWWTVIERNLINYLSAVQFWGIILYGTPGPKCPI